MSINLFEIMTRSAGALVLPREMSDTFAIEAMRVRTDREAALRGQRGGKYDSCDGIADKIIAAHIADQWGPWLGLKADDADIAMAAQGLTSFIQQVYEVKYAELPAYNGDILPISTVVDPAAEQYVWYERDLRGGAQVASTYNEDSIPMVGGPTAQPNTGRIKPFLNGWRSNFMTARREALARRNNKPDFRDEEGKRDAALRAHAEAINALWLWGDKNWSIPGLMGETRIRVIPAPNGVGGSPLWSQKTNDEIIADLNTMIDSIHQYSNNTLRATDLLLPMEQFDYIAGTPRSPNSDTTILGFVLQSRKDKGQPIKIKGVLEFNTSKSAAYTGGPENLLFNRAVVIASKPEYATFELPQRPEMPLGPRLTNLGEVTIMHSRAGGMRLQNAQSIVFFDNI